MTTITPSHPARTKTKPQSPRKTAKPTPTENNRPLDKIATVNGHAADKPLFDFSQDPGYCNADAKQALLRRGKRPPHDELSVDFSNQAARISLEAAGKPLLSGEWEWSASVRGTTLAATGQWKEVGWHREKSCDYLEIELPLSEGYKLERQMFFARDELFFFVADCLIGPPDAAAEIHYCQTLPLAGNVSFSAADETCEGWLNVKSRRSACVVPLAQPEWRSDFRHARFSQSENNLTIEQAAQGRRLLSPVWIDIHPRRIRRPITWRQLTVGENLTAVNRDVAVGYRIQSGNEQWLVYRSLAPVANRSVMGHNTYGSFVCGRIKPDGHVKDILTME
ncbi:MAG TPA: hypothetical protein VGI40_13225 [Pirellulaceae bacterium]|jgi:hypothetical protein